MEGERRKRGHVRIPVRLVTSAQQASAGFTLNLSRGGVLLHLGQAAVVGAPVQVSLDMGRQIQFAVMGKVVRVQSVPDPPGWEVAVHFYEEIPAVFLQQVEGANAHDSGDLPPPDQP